MYIYIYLYIYIYRYLFKYIYTYNIYILKMVRSQFCWVKSPMAPAPLAQPLANLDPAAGLRRRSARGDAARLPSRLVVAESGVGKCPS